MITLKPIQLHLVLHIIIFNDQLLLDTQEVFQNIPKTMKAWV